MKQFHTLGGWGEGRGAGRDGGWSRGMVEGRGAGGMGKGSRGVGGEQVGTAEGKLPN